MKTSNNKADYHTCNHPPFVLHENGPDVSYGKLHLVIVLAVGKILRILGIEFFHNLNSD